MIAIVASLVLHSILGQEIPAGVHYKKASPEVNAKFSKMLADLLDDKIAEGKEMACLDKVMICGPGLWPVIKRADKDADGKDSKFVVPIKGQKEPQVAEGRTFQTDKDRQNFLEDLKGLTQIDHVKLRPPTKEEISYYWAIIPFDIEEPLFVAEGKTFRFLFNGHDNKVFFADIVGRSKS